MSMITTFSNIFRSTYGSAIDIVDTELAIHHDALHALTGIGISIEEELVLANIENYLRGLTELTDKISEYLELIPEELIEEFITFYKHI